MLKIIRSAEQIEYYQLMDVYEESIIIEGRKIISGSDFVSQRLEGEQQLYNYLRFDFFKQSDAFCALWVENDRYMSTLRIERYKEGFLLSGLETNPNFRRRGYAKALLCAVIAHMKELNYMSLYSHVDKRNIASVQLHKSVGFLITQGSADIYLDGSYFSNSITFILN